MLARKMQPDFSKDLAKRLYDLLPTARIIPLAEVGSMPFCRWLSGDAVLHLLCRLLGYSSLHLI